MSPEELVHTAKCTAFGMLGKIYRRVILCMGKLGNGFEHFQSLYSLRKASYILGSEVWEDEFGSLLDLC